MFFDSVKIPFIIVHEKRSQTLAIEAENKIIKTFFEIKLDQTCIERAKDQGKLPYLFYHREKKILFDIDIE